MQKIMILYTYNQKYFSILKLRDSYSQIPEEKEDAELWKQSLAAVLNIM